VTPEAIVLLEKCRSIVIKMNECLFSDDLSDLDKLSSLDNELRLSVQAALEKSVNLSINNQKRVGDLLRELADAHKEILRHSEARLSELRADTAKVIRSGKAREIYERNS